MRRSSLLPAISLSVDASFSIRGSSRSMRCFGWWACLGLLCLVSVMDASAAEIPVVPAAQAGLSETKLAEVSQFMERQLKDQKIAGGIIMVSHEGKIGFFNAYGQMDIEAQKPMQLDTIFRLYSMSKAVTTAAALTLVDAGKVALDDPVSKYIPSFAGLKVAVPGGELRDPVRAMTVRDLMLHTSGLTYGSGPDALKAAFERVKPFESAKLEELAEKFAQIPLAHDPGADWTYGVSIDILGRVIEVASGQTLDAYLKQSIFEPLEMPDTGFSVPPEKIARLSANYSRTADGLKLIDAPATSLLTKPVTFFMGGGGLVGTARDYMRFLTMVQNGGELDGHRILRAETAKLMITNQLPAAAFPIHFDKERREGTGFGFGFSVRTEVKDWDTSGRVGEYGWGGAASTHYWSSPNDKLIVITLEQIMPYQWDTEFGVKKTIYDAIGNSAATQTNRRRQMGPPISPEKLADGSVTFRLRAPKASEVKVVGQFGPDAVMARDRDGVWSATVAAVPAGVHEYRFVVDGLSVIDPLNSTIKPQRWPGSSILHVAASPPAPWDLQEIPHGTVHEHTYQSKALDGWRRIFVYTPPGIEPGTRLPVLYLAHGYSDNEATWTVHGKAQWILDSLIASKQAVPMMIVMPDAHAIAPGATGFEEYGPANTAALCRELLQDIIPLVEQNYPVQAEPAGRAFAGLSMGGHHALTVALNHHDTFAWIGAFSSAPPTAANVADGLQNAEAVNRDLKLFWIACGEKDFLIKNNNEFTALLKEKGIRHEYAVTKGDHSWPVWRQYLVDLAPRLFR